MLHQCPVEVHFSIFNAINKHTPHKPASVVIFENVISTVAAEAEGATKNNMEMKKLM